MGFPRFRGRFAAYELSPDGTDATIGIDANDKRFAFEIAVELIPVFIANLRRIASAAEQARARANPDAQFRAVAPLVPEGVGVHRDNTDGTIQLTFHVGGAREAYQLKEETARTLASHMQLTADEPWTPEKLQ
jgi:hypothetical protein